MTYYSAFCEKPTPPSSHRAKRDPTAVRKALPDAAVTDRRLDHSPTDPGRRNCLIYTLTQFTAAINAKTDLVRVFA
jgi:hypothetical protein